MAAILAIYFGVLAVLISGYGLEVFLYSTQTAAASAMVLLHAFILSLVVLCLLHFLSFVDQVHMLYLRRGRFVLVGAASQIVIWGVLGYAYIAEPRSASLWEFAFVGV